MASPTLEGLANSSTNVDDPKLSASSSSRPSSSSRSSDLGERRPQPKLQVPAGLQARMGKKTNSVQELRTQVMEGEFKIKHLGLLGVLVWIL